MREENHHNHMPAPHTFTVTFTDCVAEQTEQVMGRTSPVFDPNRTAEPRKKSTMTEIAHAFIDERTARTLLERDHWTPDRLARVESLIQVFSDPSPLRDFTSYYDDAFPECVRGLVEELQDYAYGMPGLHIESVYDGDGVHVGDLNVGVYATIGGQVYHMTDFVGARELVRDRTEAGLTNACEVIGTILDSYDRAQALADRLGFIEARHQDEVTTDGAGATK